MTRDELQEEIVTLALHLDDEFGECQTTVEMIADLLHISHTEVRAVLQEVPEIG
jgi:hypothetical protein